MSGVASISVGVRLDLSGINRGLEDIGRMASTSRVGNRVGEQIGGGIADGIRRQESRISSVMTGIFMGVGQQITQTLTNAISSGVSAGMATISKSIATSAEFDRLTKTLEFVAGGAKAAAQEQSYLNQVIGQFALPAQEATKQYTALMAAARGTALEGQGVRDVFSAVSQASRVFGLSADETSGSLNALQQMISKGKISAEELNGQLGDRLPGTLQIAARAMGVTTSALMEMMQKGELLSEDFLPRFAAQLEKETRGGVAGAMNTVSAASVGLSNQLVKMQRSFGDAIAPAVKGTLDATSQILQGINVDFEDLNKLATDFSDYLKDNPQIVSEISAGIQELVDQGLEAAVNLGKQFGDYLKENPGAIKSAFTEMTKFAEVVGQVATSAAQILTAFKEWGDYIEKELEPKILQLYRRSSELLGINPETGIMGMISDASPLSTGQGSPLFQAIVAQESGGNPRAKNPRTGALGLGQVMPENVPSWTKEALGKSMTPEEFLQDTEAQIKTINFKLEQMLERALKAANGNMEIAVKRVSAEWHSGNPNNYNNYRISDGNKTTGAYADTAWSNYQKIQQSRPPVDQGAGYTVTTKNEPYKVKNPQGGTIDAEGNGLTPHHDYQNKPNGNEVRDMTLSQDGKTNVAIPSPVSGTVKFAGMAGTAGNMVKLVDSKGREVVLMHMESVAVKAGDRVTAGQKLGIQGNTGRSDGTHTHIEAPADIIKEFVRGLNTGEYGGNLDVADTPKERARLAERNREKAESDRKKAADEARRLLLERDRANQEAVEANRKSRNDKYALETERGAIGKTGADLDKYNLNREGGAKLQRLFDERADLVTARNIKVRDGVTGGIDYTAAIKTQNELIELQKDINSGKRQELDTAEKQKAIDEERIGIAQKFQNTQRETAFWEGMQQKAREREAAGVTDTLNFASRGTRFVELMRERKFEGIDRASQKIQDAEDYASRWDTLQERLQETAMKANALKIEITEGIGGAFKSAIGDLITGTKSLGEAALDILGSLASKLLDLGLNSLFGSPTSGKGLFGGILGSLFGGGLSWGDRLRGGLPKYDRGIDRVPHDQVALIHKNEAVIPANKNMERLAGRGRGDNAVAITINQHNSPGSPAMTEAQANRMANGLREEVRRIVQHEFIRESGAGGMFSSLRYT